MVWSKLKSPFRIHGKYENDAASSSRDNWDVNEEYMEAFRTKSFTDMCNKVRRQMGLRKSLDDGSTSFHDPLSSPFSSRYNIHISDGLLEPRQETLQDMIKDSNFHHLLIDYLVVSLETCKVCEQLLQIVRRVRANHRVINRIIKLAKRVMSSDYDDQCLNDHGICGEISSYSIVRNPLSSLDSVQFRATQDSHDILLEKLIAKHPRTRRKRMLTPGLLSCSLGSTIKNPRKLAKEKLKIGDDQLDVAARGVYTLMNDFDTLSRIGGRLHDEIEHGRAVAEICARNCKGTVLVELLKEFQKHETCCMELLEEFEEHIYLCLLNLSRSIGFLF